jgi:hypothetical protein
MGFAYAASDQLRDLRAKIQYQYFVVCHGNVFCGN